eukprot:gene5910-40998_t
MRRVWSGRGRKSGRKGGRMGLRAGARGGAVRVSGHWAHG